MATMEKVSRPLNAKEGRLLSSAIQRRKRRLKRAPSGMLVFGFLVLAVFLLVLITASTVDKKGPAWYQSVAIAAAMVSPLWFWAYRKREI
jgi:hypothetical protein